MSYQVGQILYVISNETQHIVPIQVFEEVCRKTAQGQEVTYYVKTGPGEATQDLKTLSGDIFRSVEEALNHLRKNFESFLLAESIWTQESEQTWYKNPLHVLTNLDTK